MVRMMLDHHLRIPVWAGARPDAVISVLRVFLAAFRENRWCFRSSGSENANKWLGDAGCTSVLTAGVRLIRGLLPEAFSGSGQWVLSLLVWK